MLNICIDINKELSRRKDTTFLPWDFKLHKQTIYSNISACSKGLILIRDQCNTQIISQHRVTCLYKNSRIKKHVSMSTLEFKEMEWELAYHGHKQCHSFHTPSNRIPSYRWPPGPRRVCHETDISPPLPVHHSRGSSPFSCCSKDKT